MERGGKVLRVIGSVLIAAGYALVMLMGILSGMLSEGLIGNVHPAAPVLAEAVVWSGAAVSLSTGICVLLAVFLRKATSLRRVVLALPFVLLAGQLLLCGIADML